MPFTAILKGADLSSTSAKKVRQELEDKLSVKLQSRKKEIDDLVMEFVSAKQNEEEGEEDEEEEEEEEEVSCESLFSTCSNLGFFVFIGARFWRRQEKEEAWQHSQEASCEEV